MFYRVSDALKVNSNESMELNDPKEFDDQGISILSRDFENQKSYGDTSIFDGLVQINAAHVTEAYLVWTQLITWNY